MNATRATDKSALLRIGEAKAKRRPRVLRLTSPTADNIEPPERKSQAAVIDWAHWAAKQSPDLRWLFAVPNAGERDKATRGLLLATGMKAGVPDLILPVARGGFFGLAIEMKVKRAKPTELQEVWLQGLRTMGWHSMLCYSATEAIEALQAYVSAPKTMIVPPYIQDVPF